MTSFRLYFFVEVMVQLWFSLAPCPFRLNLLGFPPFSFQTQKSDCMSDPNAVVEVDDGLRLVLLEMLNLLSNRLSSCLILHEGTP